MSLTTPSDPTTLTHTNLSYSLSPQKSLAGLAWGHFLNDGAAFYLPGVLPAILIAMGLSVSYAGALMTALLLGQILQPAVGLWADKIGGKTFVVFGLFGTSLGGALIGFAPNVVTLVIFLLIIGVCNSFFHPQAVSAVRSIAGNRPGFYTSIFLSGGEVGRGVWPLLASFIVTFWGVHALWVMSIPAFLSLLPLWRVMPTLPARSRTSKPLNIKEHRKPLTALLGFCIFRAYVIYSILTFIPLLWQEKGGTLSGGASFITVFMLLGIIGNLSGGHLGDRFGRKPILVIAIICSTFLLFLFLQFEGIMDWIFVGLIGIMLYMMNPLTVLIAQDIFPDNKAMGSGLVMGFTSAIGVIGVALVSPLADVWGSQLGLWLAIFGSIFAIVFSCFLPRRS